MLSNIEINKILFLDIETVSSSAVYEDLPPALGKLWRDKARFILRVPEKELTPENLASSFSERAGIYAEFGKIICISVGYFKDSTFRVTSFQGEDEVAILESFANLLHQYFGKPSQYFLCGHNIKEFDIPYICRRMVINNIDIPLSINIATKKPWEVKHLLDTMEMWKFGDYKNYTSLKLLTTILGIPSPKGDIDGSQVGNVYWNEKDLDRIVKYCERDVVAVARVIQKFLKLPLVNDDEIHFVG